MGQVTRIGMDTSKRIFQLYGVDASDRPVLEKKLSRQAMIGFFAKLEPTVIGIEACGASHHWARRLSAFGHEVRLMAPQHVKPYVRRGKNDAADAEALCEAMSRPRTRFVPAKSADDQAGLMLAGMRDQLVRRRTQLSNTIRGYAAEFGLTAGTGLSRLAPLLERIQADATVPAEARWLFTELAAELAELALRLAEIERALLERGRACERARRLTTIPGIGPITAVMLTLKLPNPEAFASGRQFAAWVGLTPKDHSTAGRQRLGVITRAGDPALRSLLVLGATAVIRQVRHGPRQASPWLAGLLHRKEPKEAAVALANKMARIAWKLMISGQAYDPARAA